MNNAYSPTLHYMQHWDISGEYAQYEKSSTESRASWASDGD